LAMQFRLLDIHPATLQQQKKSIRYYPTYPHHLFRRFLGNGTLTGHLLIFERLFSRMH
jgi:hypothetical protein